MDRTGILFVADSLQPGEAQDALATLVRGLNESGRYRPVVVCLHDSGPSHVDLAESEVVIHEYSLDSTFDFKIIARLVRLIRQERIRIVVSLSNGSASVLWGILSARAAGAKRVVWSHTYSRVSHPGFSPSERVLYPLVDRFIGLGGRHRRNLAWFDKVPAGRIRVIPHGVDVDRFDHPEWRDRARSILGLADEGVIAVGMVGRLLPHNRHDIFINAAKQAARQHCDVHFFIIGSGPELATVQRWAHGSDLLGQTLSLVGHRDDIAQLLPGLDLLCLCSEYQDCLSTAALQAMATRVPVVSNGFGSIDEVIADNRTGFLYRPLTASALAERLLDVIGQPELRQDVADRAYRQIKEKFTAQMMAQRFCRLFDEMLAVRPDRQIG
jgi:glycosyltransferase involved in cell wall biosynthesis